LREAVAAAGRHPRDARGFGMKDRRAHPDEGRREQDRRIVGREREQQQPAKRGRHADGQRVRHVAAIGVDADQRLEQRCRHLERQRDQADLHEAQLEIALEDRIDRHDQRLHHVVDHVRGADRPQHAERGFRAIGRRREGGG